jgi:hypothetical protein
MERWSGEEVEETCSKTTITVELFMAGNLLFYDIALGKEGFATWWCN